MRGRALGELQELMELVQEGYPDRHEKDKWVWLMDDQGVFTVKRLKELVDEKVLGDPVATIETKWNPRKVNIFIWQLRQDHLPVRTRLDHLGIDLDSTLCPCCLDTVETRDHCFFRCNWVEKGWEDIFKWWNLDKSNFSSIRELVTHEGRSNFVRNQRCLWQAMVWSTAYIIWSMRNKVIFEGKKTRQINLCVEVQLLSFFWIKNRKKGLNISCSSWCLFPEGV